MRFSYLRGETNVLKVSVNPVYKLGFIICEIEGGTSFFVLSVALPCNKTHNVPEFLFSKLRENKPTLCGFRFLNWRIRYPYLLSIRRYNAWDGYELSSFELLRLSRPELALLKDKERMGRRYLYLPAAGGFYPEHPLWSGSLPGYAGFNLSYLQGLRIEGVEFEVNGGVKSIINFFEGSFFLDILHCFLNNLSNLLQASVP